MNKKILSSPKATIRTVKETLGIPYNKSIAKNQVLGRKVFRELAFANIPGLRELIAEKKYNEARILFIDYAGYRTLDPKESLADHVFSRTVYMKERARYWQGSFMKAAMDSFPELKFNIFDFWRLPKYMNVHIFDKEFVERCGYKRTDKYFIIDQAKDFFHLDSDEAAIVYIVRKLDQGKRIFPREEVNKAAAKLKKVS